MVVEIQQKEEEEPGAQDGGRFFIVIVSYLISKEIMSMTKRMNLSLC